jgi:4-amino-4-deoxy-L-arabinose transferase-like glycosyltransferase
MLSILLIGFLFGSAERAIDKIQEARIAETSREMVVDGDWLVPHYNGELRLQKPPLTYWTTALSYKIFGVSEQAARAPSLFFGLLSALLLLVWIKQELNIDVAINAALVMATSFLGLRYIRSAEADATLLFFISLACFASYQWLLNPNKKMAYLFMLSIGLAFMTKGPAGIAIPVLTMLTYAFFTQQLKLVKGLLSPVGLCIFVFSAFVWYAWIIFTMPDIAQQFFSKQVDETFITGTHQQPVYWYLAHAIEFFAPWSLLLIPAGIWCYQYRKHSNNSLPKIVHFALIWLLVVFVLLTFTVNKQTQYALLFLPSIAILIGYYIHVGQNRFYQFNRVVYFLLIIAVIVLFVLGIRKHGLETVFSFPKVLIWPLLFLAPFTLKKILKLTTPSTPMLFASICATFVYLFTEQYLTKDAEKEDIKQLVQSVVQRAEVKHALYQAKPGDGAVSFYAQRPIKPLDEQQIQTLLSKQNTLWIVAKEKPLLAKEKVVQENQIGRWALWKISQ